jgi:hypothetical protein
MTSASNSAQPGSQAWGSFPAYEGVMSSYRCYFLDGDSRIKARNELELSTVAEAIDKAGALLKAHPEHHSVEIWHDAQLVYAMCSENPPSRSGSIF